MLGGGGVSRRGRSRGDTCECVPLVDKLVQLWKECVCVCACLCVCMCVCAHVHECVCVHERHNVTTQCGLDMKRVRKHTCVVVKYVEGCTYEEHG